MPTEPTRPRRAVRWTWAALTIVLLTNGVVFLVLGPGSLFSAVLGVVGVILAVAAFRQTPRRTR